MGGGCQRKSWKLKLTLPIPIASPFSNSKQIPPSLGDQACTQPGGTSRGSPRASTFLPLFWENSLSSGPFWLSLALPPYHGSVASVHHLLLPLKVPGLLQIMAHPKLIPVPTAWGRGQERGRKRGGVGQGLKMGTGRETEEAALPHIIISMK